MSPSLAIYKLTGFFTKDSDIISELENLVEESDGVFTIEPTSKFGFLSDNVKELSNNKGLNSEFEDSEVFIIKEKKKPSKDEMKEIIKNVRDDLEKKIIKALLNILGRDEVIYGEMIVKLYS